MTRDIAQLKLAVNIVDVIGKYISLKKTATEFVGMCPFHNDKHASLQVNEKKQVFKCFACGAGGDAIDYLTLKGNTFDESMKELEELAGNVPYAKKKSTAAEWKQIIPPGEIQFEIKHYEYGAPTKKWRYADEKNQLIGYVCRFDFADRKKETWPFVYCEKIADPSIKQWRWKGFEKPRALYRLYYLVHRPNDIVLLVEGEKTCDAAQKLFPELACTTWQGGSKAVHATNWEPLRGRKKIIWQDNDQAGFQAMNEIKAFFPGEQIRAVMMDEYFSEHWDLADPMPYNYPDARKYFKDHLYNL